MKRVILRVMGMTCSKCFERVTQTVTGFPEVKKLSIDGPSGLLTLEVAERTDLHNVIRAVEQCGKPRHHYSVAEITGQSLNETTHSRV